MRSSGFYAVGNAGLILLALSLGLGFLAKFGVFDAIDRAILSALVMREGQSWQAAITTARTISWLGNPSQRAIICVLIAATLLWQKRWQIGIAMVVIPALAGATASILKEGFATVRPALAPPLDIVTSLSYPSGHAAGASALSVLIIMAFGGKRRLVTASAAIYAILIGVSRLWLGVHWPIDVVGGWLWGAGIACVLSFVMMRQDRA